MLRLFLITWLAVLVQAQPLAPKYSAESLVNAASNTAVPLAPNTIATLYGANLSFGTRTVTEDDLRGNTLPTVLPGTGVRILVANQPVAVYFVSPTQVNFLVPSNLIAGKFNLELIRDGLAGPKVPIVIELEAPQPFVQQNRYVIAQRQDTSVITPESPVRPGELVCVYVTGLGRVSPELPYGQIGTTASPIVRKKDFRVYLNGNPIDPTSISYVGLTPGVAGLYQVNFRLPADAPDDPEIRLGFEEPESEPNVWLAVKREMPPAESPNPAALQ